MVLAFIDIFPHMSFFEKSQNFIHADRSSHVENVVSLNRKVSSD